MTKEFIKSIGLITAILLVISYFTGPLVTVSIILGIITAASLAYYTQENNIVPILSIKRSLKIILFLAIVTVVYTDAIKMNNKAVVYENEYSENEDNKAKFVENLYSVYTEKQNIANINKQAFVEITYIVMQGRKDGASLSWKWLQENQPIPYQEFTSFYKDLSSFIATYKTECYNFEAQTNRIIKEHNTLLSVFPNNMYNKVLHIPMLRR